MSPEESKYSEDRLRAYHNGAELVELEYILPPERAYFAVSIHSLTLLSIIKRSDKYAAKPFALRGLIKCSACGGTMTPDFKKGRYVYLCCHNYNKRKCSNNVRVRQEVVLEQVKEFFDKLYLEDEDIQDISTYLKESKQTEIEFNRVSVEGLNKEYALIQEKINRLLDLAITPKAGDFSQPCISEDIYTAKLQELRQEAQHSAQKAK